MSDWADATFKELVETAWTTALKWQDTYMDQATPMGIKDQQRAELTAKRSAIIAELERRSTALRDAARVPEGCVRTADGVDRKVLGTLPMTADGCIVTPGVEVFHPEQDSDFHLSVLSVEEWMDDDDDWKLPEECFWVGFYNYYEHDTGYSQREIRDLRTCYSTREAALAQPTPARGEARP